MDVQLIAGRAMWTVGLVLTLVGCSEQSAPATALAAGAGGSGGTFGGAPGTAAGQSGTGQPGAGSGANGAAGGGPAGDGGMGPETTLPGAPADGGADDSAAGRDLIAPSPVEPCDEALDAQHGAVAPDFGELPKATAFTGDPNDDGPFGVLEVDVTIPNPDTTRAALDATFYAPSEVGGSTVVEGQHPLVLVMHGFGATHRNYLHFTRHIASHGFVVLGITLPPTFTAAHDKNAVEASAAIDFALSGDVPAALVGHIDAERVAVAGHSFGGKIAFYAASLDPRIDLVIGWDPSNAGGPPCFIDAMMCNGFPVAPNCMAMSSGIVHQMHAESVIFRAAADGANPEPAHNAIHFYRGAPSPATLLDFDTNVLHGDFANPAAAVLPHTRRVQIAFLLTRLQGVTGLESYLPGGAKIGDDSRLVRVLSRP